MADMKISDLPAATDALDAQQFEVNDSGTSRRVTFGQMRTKIKTWLDTVYAGLGHHHDTAYAAKSHHHDGTYASASHTHTVDSIADRGGVGDALMKANDKAAARNVIGAGTGNSNLALGWTATTAKPGNWRPHVDTDTAGQLPWSRLSGVPDAVTNGNLPDALGVGSYVLAYAANGVSLDIGGIASGANVYRTPLTQYLTGGGKYLTSHWDGNPNTLAGTWRNMGGGTSYRSGSTLGVCLFLRIA